MPKTSPTRDKIHLLDRATVAWRDHQGTWQGHRESETYVHSDAPAGLHVSAVLQDGDPYLWIGIAAPDTFDARICYAVIRGEALFDLARAILQCKAKSGGAR
jgi:hypothetical protein